MIAHQVGELMTEHPQNLHLAKIIEVNEKIRRVFVEAAVDRAEAVLYGATKEVGETSRQGMDVGDGDEEEALAAQADSAMSSLSKVMTDWIELQNAVNCYMDSAKDPNPLGTQAAPAGIRQLLERKEGLFRRHMMGKRVNYCCRSVISPDPYIGTNEVGIPVLFAKTLHYPTPVNDWNVKYLRKLVENGPDIYPGSVLYW